jgi:hypothetical protein
MLAMEPDYLLDLEVLSQPHLDPKPWWGFLLYYLHDKPHTFLCCVRCRGGDHKWGRSPVQFFFAPEQNFWGIYFASILGSFGTWFSGPWFSNVV